MHEIPRPDEVEEISRKQHLELHSEETTKLKADIVKLIIGNPLCKWHAFDFQEYLPETVRYVIDELHEAGWYAFQHRYIARIEIFDPDYALINIEKLLAELPSLVTSIRKENRFFLKKWNPAATSFLDTYEQYGLEIVGLYSWRGPYSFPAKNFREPDLITLIRTQLEDCQRQLLSILSKKSAG